MPISVYLPLHGQLAHCEELIQRYFRIGFKYSEILLFLAYYHGIYISMRTLNRMLASFDLKRRRQICWNRILDAVEIELNGTSKYLGYRAMQAKLRLTYGVYVSRESIRTILQAIDPEGVAARQRRRLRRRRYISKGPGFVYHIDGWDKLKRFGLCVHGCIDGFSRKIMWLEAAPTNNDPYVICKFFGDTVRHENGLPLYVRADRGTENVNVELMQRTLRSENGDLRGRLQTTFLYGPSPANQRIESWWSKFPSFSMQVWIDHFIQMETVGVIDASLALHIQAIRFVYLKLLRYELQNIVTWWNTHHIRQSRNVSSPAGKPDIMFHMPELYGTMSYLMPLDPNSLDIISPFLTRDIPDNLPIYGEIFQTIMEEYNMTLPTNLDAAANVLVTLLDVVEHDIANA